MGGRRRTSCVKWCLLLLVGCGGCGYGERRRTEASTEFEPNAGLFIALGRTDRLDLYEGLPHQGREILWFEEERALKPSGRRHGFLFYLPRLRVADGDAAEVRALLGSIGSFGPWQGERKCDGFHPDFLAECQSEGEVYRVLLCFGCGEAKVYGPNGAVRCDLARPARERLEAVLSKYHRDLPRAMRRDLAIHVGGMEHEPERGG